MNHNHTVRVDDLGRVVIPRDMRARLGIQDGTRVEFTFNGNDELVLRKSTPKPDSIYGLNYALAVTREDDALDDEEKAAIIKKLQEAITLLLAPAKVEWG